MDVTSSPSDYLAAERTFLAWIRTGLALMGFGFVVARFGLFLRALQIGQPNLPAQSYGLIVLVRYGAYSAWSDRQHLVRAGITYAWFRT